MNRVFNFSAGPSVLPENVLKQAASEMLDYNGSGMSVMEMSHRSSIYEEIIGTAQQSLRTLLNIPNNYKVLFLQGGASMQFAMVPLNLFKNKKADYILTGMWAKKASKEASRYGQVNIVASSEDENFSYIPDIDSIKFNSDSDYVHITTNNTIYGTKYNAFPNTQNIPLVADASSNILSEPLDVSKFGLIYAGAQKNMGPAGLTVVIIRDDLIGNALDFTPTMLNYQIHSENDSMYNTPPTYAIYICKLVCEHLLKMGGLEQMSKINYQKANMFYDFLDNSHMFSATARKDSRSIMNIPFVTGNEELDKIFIKDATKNGLVNLKGHRFIGGMRASIYNAMPVEGVEALIKFMTEFENRN